MSESIQSKYCLQHSAACPELSEGISGSDVTLKVYDLLGREVAVLEAKQMSAGSHRVTWMAASLPASMYFHRLTAGDFDQTRKTMLTIVN